MSKPFKPLLAKALEEENFNDVKFPMVGSPKLDGIRVLIIDGVAMSRNLKPIRNSHVQSILGSDLLNGLDGEIIVGDPCDKLVYRNTSSGVMSGDGQPDFRFYVFDSFLADGPWVQRIGEVEQLLESQSNFVLLESKVLNSVEEMLAYEQECLDKGYEGIMLRDPQGRYKQGRSTLNEAILLKLKRFTDFEGLIVGYQERMHNANEAKTNALGHTERSMHKENMIGRNDLGAIWVAIPKAGFSWPVDEDKRMALVKQISEVVPSLDSRTKLDIYNETSKTHVLFTVGSGFTDDERVDFWNNKEKYLGAMVKLQAFNYGGYELPRFPTYLGLREDL